MNTKRRTLISIAIGVGAVILIGGGGGLLAQSASGFSIGREMEELNGQTHTTHYSSASDAPATDVPAWFPHSASSITVEVPGPNSKGPGGVQVDAAVPAGYTLPGSCAPNGQGFPWAGGYDGLNVRTAPLSTCDGWTAVVQDAHLYAWKSYGPAS